MNDLSLIEYPVKDFIEKLASADPEPGGGSAAALTASMAAALVTMVANLTLGKEKYAKVEHRVSRIKASSEALRVRLDELVILDAHAYGTVIMATQLPAGTQAARAERARWIQEALIDAAQVPYQVAEAALEVARLSLEIVKIGNHHAVSDAGMAAVLSHAAAQSAALNVKINLASIKDKKFKLRMWTDTMRILKEMADLEHQVLSVTYEKL